MSRCTRRLTWLLVAATNLSFAAPVTALTARDLLDRAKALEEGERKWDDRVQSMSLQITDANGGLRERRLKVFTQRHSFDEEKTLSFLLAPAEIKGTGFLQWSHRGRDDEQWIYLPEFRRSRQIAASVKDESFVGTDFSYRDLEIIGKFLRWTESEAPATLGQDMNIDGHPCHAIELRPQQEGTPYGKIIVALEHHRLVARQLSFFDRAGTNIKVLTTNDVRDIGSIPTTHRFEMQSLKNGSRTVATLEEVQFNTNLGDDLFTVRALERGAP